MKLRAAADGRKLRDVATEIFRRGLARTDKPDVTAVRRVRLPLVECGRLINVAMEMSADQMAGVLVEQEGGWSHDLAKL